MSETPSKPIPGILRSLSAAEAATLDERGVPTKLGRQYRRAQVESSGYNSDDHTVEFTLTSEYPVERYYGVEILSHKKGAIRTDRLKNGIALLFNHDYDKQIGRSVSFEAPDGGPLKVKARFGPSAFAQEKEADIAARILTDTSGGYVVYEWEITEDKNGVRTYLAVDWEPIEGSMVTVPADPTVGAGRAAGDEAIPVKYTFKRSADPDGASDPEDGSDPDDPDGDDPDPEAEDERSAAAAAQTSTTSSTTTSTPEQQRTVPMAEATTTVDHAAENKARIEGLRAIRTANPDHFSENDLLGAIADGTDIRTVKEQVADKIIEANKSGNVRTLGGEVTGKLNEREQKQYSLVRAMRYAINQRFPGTFKEDAEAGFEREIADEIRKEAGKRGVSVGGGLLIANDLPINGARAHFAARRLQTRTMTAATSTAAIPTETMTTPIELLRARAVCMRLGATSLSGVKGLLRIPRQTSASTSNWLAESAAGTDSGITLDDITFSPNRLNTVGSWTLELLNQEAFAVEDLLRMDQVLVKALSYDLAALTGSGTNNVPLGLLNRTGLAAILTGSTRDAVSGALTAGAGATPLTYVDLNNFEAAISTANADEAGMAWACTPRIRAALRSTPKFPSGIMDPIWPGNSIPTNEGLQDGPLGYRAAVSNQIPSNLSFTPSGGSLTSGLHAMILGYWPSMIFCDWGISELVVDNITQASQGTYRVIENSLHDVNVRHIEHFAASQCVKVS